MSRHPWPVTAVALTLSFGALAACSSAADPLPFAATAPASPAPVTTLPTSSNAVPAHNSGSPTAVPSPTPSATPTKQPPKVPKAAPTTVVTVASNPFTPQEERAISLVRTYEAAILAQPSKAGAATIARVSSPSCKQCRSDEQLIRGRALAGQTIVDETGDPTWGALVFSRRPSVKSGSTTVRVAYNEAPGKVVDRAGTVVDRADSAEYFEFLYLVDDRGGKPQVTSITRVV